MLYEASVGSAASEQVAMRYGDLFACEPLASGIHATAAGVVVTRASATVVPTGGAAAAVTLPYGWLVVAVAGQHFMPMGIPGLDADAYPLHSHEGAVAKPPSLPPDPRGTALACWRRRSW